VSEVKTGTMLREDSFLQQEQRKKRESGLNFLKIKRKSKKLML